MKQLLIAAIFSMQIIVSSIISHSLNGALDESCGMISTAFLFIHVITTLVLNGLLKKEMKR